SSTKAPGPDGLGFECIKMAYRAIPDYFHTLYEVLKKLRVRYNHSQRKNHTKFFAKLFSHWLKTPLFRLHPLFYRERSPQTTFIMSSTSSKGKKKTTFKDRKSVVKGKKIYAPFLLQIRKKWKQNTPTM